MVQQVKVEEEKKEYTKRESIRDIETRIGGSLKHRLQELFDQNLTRDQVGDILDIDPQKLDRLLVKLGLTKMTILVDCLHEVVHVTKRTEVDEPQIVREEKK